MSLEKEINILFRMALDLEARQKKGEHVTEKEVENLKSLTLVVESISECMVPEKGEEKPKKSKKEKILTE